MFPCINVIHRSTHIEPPPPVVSLLRSLRLIIPRDEHRLHHLKETVNFCIFNGWANPLLNYVLHTWEFPIAINLAKEIAGAPVEWMIHNGTPVVY